ncbi:nitrite reductase small subunit NirD [Balneatrix alpica]|uniref:Nitrite reductase small subunit NirD n=1 Tax=Balneatrix alpica TaxID=75684 RepID=A0ABV5Z7I8_9GAMM|nr:nitrite reductase small subunit NirD [Balneatrix alpica]
MKQQWINVCSQQDLVEDAGVAALVQEQQIALFYLAETAQVFALSNQDPVTGANVISRGLIAEVKGRLAVAAPLLKQHYDLHSGQCLDKEELSLQVWPARLDNGQVQILI